MFFEEAMSWVWIHVRKDLLVVQCPLARSLDTYTMGRNLHGDIHGVDCVTHNEWTNIMDDTYYLMQVLNHRKGSRYPSCSFL
jgi:hypothetical protein